MIHLLRSLQNKESMVQRHALTRSCSVLFCELRTKRSRPSQRPLDERRRRLRQPHNPLRKWNRYRLVTTSTSDFGSKSARLVLIIFHPTHRVCTPPCIFSTNSKKPHIYQYNTHSKNIRIRIRIKSGACGILRCASRERYVLVQLNRQRRRASPRAMLVSRRRHDPRTRC